MYIYIYIYTHIHIIYIYIYAYVYIYICICIEKLNQLDEPLVARPALGQDGASVCHAYASKLRPDICVVLMDTLMNLLHGSCIFVSKTCFGCIPIEMKA